MAAKAEVKQGTTKGKRVYWFVCPKCGPFPEHPSKAGANGDKKRHVCDG